MSKLNDFISVKDICEYLGVHHSMVYKKLGNNELPGAVKFGNVWRIDREKFMEYIKMGGDKSNVSEI